ncbi:ArsR/SmtB family transcription factor [Actinomadura gamaensis]|uniref:ArsR/SmtB family transcription factor n=1 Tax=Actinomadura gamaensis TaxID=1763541 RepID=A0ABV9TZN4_9ACTN
MTTDPGARSGGDGPISDPVRLRALAHPTRLALLDVLGTEGTATATRCAELLGERVAGCSFHLRVLARHGFIEPVARDGRERPWRLKRLVQAVDTTGMDDEQEQAVDAVTEQFLEREFARLRTWRRMLRDEPPEWRRASFALGVTVWMTPEELDEFREELTERADELLARYRDRIEDAGGRPERSRPIRFFAGAGGAPPATGGGGTAAGGGGDGDGGAS